MPTQSVSQRMLFTFRSNGVANEPQLVEATAEHLEVHEVPADQTDANERSWFGAADDVGPNLQKLDSARSIEGVLSALHTNRITTREFEILSKDLERAGFAESV